MNFARTPGTAPGTTPSVILAALMGLGGCFIGSDAQVSVEVAQIVNEYHGYPLINTAPYGSTLGAFNINVYVSSAGATAYAAIAPEKSGTNSVVPVGTVIVRQVLDSAGTVSKLTFMVKASEDTNPTCGGWWFGVTDPSGKVLADASGTVQAGAIPACQTCHIPRATDDYLFGVPAADK